MADLNHRKVIKAALASRLLSLVAQSVFNHLVPDYDTSEEHCSSIENSTGQILSSTTKNWNCLADQAILFLVGGNAKWDAVYFLDISRNGYQYEQNMAFFPLLPILVYSLGSVLKPVQLLFNLHQNTMLILAATIINTAAFIWAALGLFCLSKKVFRSQKLAYRSALFFCFNPASVFFSAAYSESLFAMTQFWGMFFLENDESWNPIAAALLFCLGTAARSNGTVSSGFIIYKMLREMFGIRYGQDNMKASHLMGILFLKIVMMALLVLIVVLPFVAFQYYGFVVFCHLVEKSPWCKEYIPIPYSFIQKHYWNVGFLKYFQLKQLPNFLLAIPLVSLGVLGIVEYLVTLSLADILSLGLIMPMGYSRMSQSGHIFVYAVHLTFLLLFGVTSMHVQVVTRFVACSSPTIYWFAATWTTPQLNPTMKSNMVFVYFLTYYWLGFLLHCNFYPWT